MLFGTIGMALGSWLAARIFDLTGSYAPAFLVGFGFNALNLLVIVALLWRQVRGTGPRYATAING